MTLPRAASSKRGASFPGDASLKFRLPGTKSSFVEIRGIWPPKAFESTWCGSRATTSSEFREAYKCPGCTFCAHKSCNPPLSKGYGLGTTCPESTMGRAARLHYRRHRSGIQSNSTNCVTVIPDARINERGVHGAKSRCNGTDKLAGLPDLIKITWLPCCRSLTHPAFWKARTARSPETEGSAPLNRNLHLTDCDRQRHVIRLARCQATHDRLPNILEGLRFRSPLRNASRNGGALGDNRTGLIRFQHDEKLYTWILHGLDSCGKSRFCNFAAPPNGLLPSNAGHFMKAECPPKPAYGARRSQEHDPETGYP